MASAAVVCGGLIALVLFILQTVGVATHYWYVVEVPGVASLSAGLFQICAEYHLAVLSASSKCFTHSDYITTGNLVNFNYYAIAGLSVVGCIILFCSVIVGLVGCASTRPGRPTVQNLGGLWFCAAGCTIAAVVWFYVTQYQDSQTLLALTSLVETKLGYSFYLTAVSGGATLVAAITMCVTANHMDVPQSVAPLAAPAGPQVFVMQSGVPQQGPTGYTQTGYPQTGYPQAGAGYGGQQFAPMANAPPPPPNN